MTTAIRTGADSALLDFEESIGSVPPIEGCGCPGCAARPRRARPDRPAVAARITRAVRTTCLATSVLAGAGAVGLTAGAGQAQAAPGKQGWDGSRYWFENARGEWRWTAHRDVYLARTGQSGRGAGESAAQGGEQAPTSAGGMRQGWDGSRYWFRNARGEWRWTAHRDVYLARTGGGGATGTAGSGGTARPSGTGGGTPAAAAPTAGRTEAAVRYALAQLGKPYVWGGDGPGGFDCSGLVQQAFRRSGIELPRVADDQYAATTPLSRAQLRRGDLVFWSDTGRASGIHHVGIYLGDGTFVEAPRPGRTVRISTFGSDFRPTHFGRP